MKINQLKFAFLCYFVVLIFYTVFSFSLTDPNLVLLSWGPYWNFQQFMWHTFFENHVLLSWTYAALITALFGAYAWIIKASSNSTLLMNWKLAGCYFLLLLPLFFSYNALSYDVFNYIFNAKMVLIYHANPYVQVALDFAQDPWVRFMHNTHTTAPYGYGWTLFSLLPFELGFGKFVPTWLMFRFFSVLSIFLLYVCISFAKKKEFLVREFVILFLNPLFVLEVVSNAHNDLWMMVPALYAVAMVFDHKKGSLKKCLIATALMIFSISMKFASLLLLPLIGASFHHKVKQYWPEIAALLMFVLLLTNRSQQFHPWYLTWVLVWFPFIKNKLLKQSILVLSVSSLFRYVPWMWNGYFSDQIILQQKMITWIPLVLFLIVMSVNSLWKKLLK